MLDIQARVGDVAQGQTQMRIELAALGQQLAGLTTAVYSGHNRIADIERRIDRIEARLNLNDE